MSYVKKNRTLSFVISQQRALHHALTEANVSVSTRASAEVATEVEAAKYVGEHKVFSFLLLLVLTFCSHFPLKMQDVVEEGGGEEEK